MAHIACDICGGTENLDENFICDKCQHVKEKFFELRESNISTSLHYYRVRDGILTDSRKSSNPL